MRYPLILLIIVLVSSCATPQNQIKKNCKITDPSVYGFESTDEIYRVEGYGVGPGGSRGEFYKLSREIYKEGELQDFREMLDDPCSAVRIMGLVCLLRSGQEVEILHDDESMLYVRESGCFVNFMTAEELSEKLINDHWYQYCFRIITLEELDKLEKSQP